MPRLRGEHVQVGGAVEVHGAKDRLAEFEQTMARAFQEKMAQADREVEAVLQKAAKDAMQTAQDIIAEARNRAVKEAQAILQDAESRRDAVLRQAYQEGEHEGYERGYTDAFQKSEAEAVQMLQSASVLLEGAYAARDRVMRGFQKQALELVRYIAGRVVRRELETNLPEGLLNMIAHAIEDLRLTGKIKLVISAEAMQQLQSYGEGTANALERLSRFQLTTDPQLTLTEIFISGEEGCFLIHPETEIRNLTEVLENQLPLPDGDDEGVL